MLYCLYWFAHMLKFAIPCERSIKFVVVFSPFVCCLLLALSSPSTASFCFPGAISYRSPRSLLTPFPSPLLPPFSVPISAPYSCFSVHITLFHFSMLAGSVLSGCIS